MSILDSIPGGAKWLHVQKLANAGLTKELKVHFKYAKIKGNLLVFCFNNGIAKFEFRNKKIVILDNLRNHYKEHIKTSKALGIIFNDIHAIVIANKESIPPASIKDNYKFKEDAKGTFTNKVTDPKLHKLFEDIRESIKENQT